MFLICSYATFSRFADKYTTYYQNLIHHPSTFLQIRPARLSQFPLRSNSERLALMGRAESDYCLYAFVTPCFTPS